MAGIPDVIPIAPVQGRLEHVGHLPDGRQFIALPPDAGVGVPLIHFFSGEGAHLETDHGDSDETDQAAAFERMLRQLEPCQREAVTVQPFETEVEGRRVGLIAGDGRVRLDPPGIAFGAPWDGQPQD